MNANADLAAVMERLGLTEQPQEMEAEAEMSMDATEPL